MKVYKHIWAAVLALAMLVGVTLPITAASSDADVSDGSTGAWYAEAADWCRDNGLIGEEESFEPDAVMSRSALAAALYRSAGSPAVSGELDFSDVDPDADYVDAVIWARDNGLIIGYGNGYFGTGDPVTREQLATILWRYAGSPSVEDAEVFTDEAEIAPYARAAAVWAKAEGLMDGIGENRFAPKSDSTGAQAVAVLQRGFVGALADKLVIDEAENEGEREPEETAQPSQPEGQAPANPTGNPTGGTPSAGGQTPPRESAQPSQGQVPATSPGNPTGGAPSAGGQTPPEEREEQNGGANTPEPSAPPASIRQEALSLTDGTGETVSGMMYLPGEVKDSYPTVILSHGFGGWYNWITAAYAEEFARNGFAACAFNFRPDGKTDMLNTSVLTEAATLNSVINQIKDLPYTDDSKIFLFGESQGGFVSAYVAADRPEDAAALVLLYPAFVLQDDAQKRNPDGSEPDTIMGTPVSGLYSSDALSFDIYEKIGNYTKSVLIIHGTNDSIVPLSYSEKAVGVYPNVVLKTIPGAGHGFSGGNQTQAARWAVEFVLSEIAK